jgi:RIO kinase 1
MGKRSRHGRERDEEHWKSAEADVIRRLFSAGVRVPKPYAFVDGVLLMECISGPGGGPAPRLAECAVDREDARELFEQLIRDVVKMLCADIVHGDLSLFNVLLEDDGAVIIDFPQAINAAENRNAKRILLRDVANLTAGLMQGVPQKRLRHAHEMWSLYERGELMPDTPLTGEFRLSRREIDAEELLGQMLEVEEDEAMSTDDEFGRRPPPRSKKGSGSGSDSTRGSNRPKRGKAPAGPQVVVKGAIPPPTAAASPSGEPPKKRRRRRRGGRKK